MNSVLIKIKRLIIRGSYLFTAKAESERLADGLSEEDVIESILNATVARSKRSTSEFKKSRKEKVNMIEGFTFDGVLIYTKGVIRKVEDREVFYIIVSSKKSKLGN